MLVSLSDLVSSNNKFTTFPSTEDVETDQMIEMEDEEIGFSGILQIGKMMMK